jgi:hypothetical protein
MIPFHLKELPVAFVKRSFAGRRRVIRRPGRSPLREWPATWVAAGRNGSPRRRIAANGMRFARAFGQRLSRLLALALFLLAGLGSWPRLAPAPAGCGAGAHACCCAPAGLSGCACSGQAGPAAQIASLAACSDPAEAPIRVLVATPGLAPEARAASLALLPTETLTPPPTAEVASSAPEPSSPPPRPCFLSLLA